MNKKADYRNELDEVVQSFGGVAAFARIFSRLSGTIITRQTAHAWMLKGCIPYKHRYAADSLLKEANHMFPNPQAFKRCISKRPTYNEVISPNLKLQAWVNEQGGIGEVVKKANDFIKHSNEDTTDEEKEKKWTYVMVHNWIKRGVISDRYKMDLIAILNCPKEVLDDCLNRTKKHESKTLTKDELLG